MACWAVLRDQTVWISPLATGFTVVCERCAELGDDVPLRAGDALARRVRGSIECPRGHQIRIERDGR